MGEQKRMTPADRKQQILAAAVKLAEKDGFQTVTGDKVAAELNISKQLVFSYFGNMKKLRNAIVRAAVVAKPPVLAIVAQGLAAGNSEAKRAPEDVRKKAIALMAA